MIKKIKPRVKIFVEGTAEKNYFEAFAKNFDLNYKIEVSNVAGGGYKTFITKMKKSSDLGYTMIFVVLDLDKLYKEWDSFNELKQYCENRNKRGSIPYIFIGNNMDFEYFCCLHSDKYREGCTNQFIKKEYKYKCIDDFKADKFIFNFLNRDGKSIENAIGRLNSKKSYINNKYKAVNKKNGDISLKVSKIMLCEEMRDIKNSNMNEFYDIIVQATR